MKRILVALALGAALSLTIAATPADKGRNADCMTTNDLTIGQDIGGTSQDMNRIGGATNASSISNRLSGTITNNSLEQGYDNVMVRVDYFDEDNNAVGSETIKVRKDIDPGDTENFTASIHTPAGATRASYSVDCAEHDRGWFERMQFWRNT
jgi:hypothetical protein